MAQERVAEPKDISNIVELVKVAMDESPLWDSIYPGRKEFPADHHNNVRTKYGQFLDPENKDWCVRVLELASGENDYELVAFSVWNIASINGNNCGSLHRRQQRLYQASLAALPR